MPILWIAVYCLIAVLVLFALTYQCELRDEEQRCKKLAKNLRSQDAGEAKVNHLPPSS